MDSSRHERWAVAVVALVWVFFSVAGLTMTYAAWFEQTMVWYGRLAVTGGTIGIVLFGLVGFPLYIADRRQG
jgi:hypothetical protein